jgi:peroxiredoxin
MKPLMIFMLYILPLFCFGQKRLYGIEHSKGIPVGLEIGAEAPNFLGRDIQSGQPIEMKKLISEGALVIIFYRGAWCPVCNRYLSGFQDSIEMIQDVGAQVLAIGPETEDNVEKTIEASDWKGMVISDKQGLIMDDFKVSFDVRKAYQRKIKTVLSADIAEQNDQEEARLPVPATYIVNSHGKIFWRHFDLNYKNRASVKEILEALKNQ